MATCAASGKTLFIPSGTFAFASPIVAPPCSIIGEGQLIASLKYTGPAGSAAITSDISAPTAGIVLKDFGVIESTPGVGNNGLTAKLRAGAFLSNFRVEHCYFGQFAGPGLIIDNSVGNTDGFFCGEVVRSLSCNGIVGTKLGDSIEFNGNTLTSVSDTIGNNAFGLDISSLAGARQIVISNNNFTTGGGAIRMANADQVTIRNNQCEFPWQRMNYTGGEGAMVVLANCNKTVIAENTISPGSASSPNTPAHAIRFKGVCKGGVIEKNDIYKGLSSHIRFDEGTYGTIIDASNSWGVDGRPVLSEYNPLLYPQIGVDIALNLINGWVPDGSFGPAEATIRLGRDGICETFGAVQNGSGNVAMLPALMKVRTSRNLTTAKGSTVSFSTMQVDGGEASNSPGPYPIQCSSSPGVYASLTGLRFRYWLI